MVAPSVARLTRVHGGSGAPEHTQTGGDRVGHHRGGAHRAAGAVHAGHEDRVQDTGEGGAVRLCLDRCGAQLRRPGGRGQAVRCRGGRHAGHAGSVYPVRGQYRCTRDETQDQRAVRRCRVGHCAECQASRRDAGGECVRGIRLRPRGAGGRRHRAGGRRVGAGHAARQDHRVVARRAGHHSARATVAREHRGAGRSAQLRGGAAAAAGAHPRRAAVRVHQRRRWHRLHPIAVVRLAGGARSAPGHRQHAAQWRAEDAGAGSAEQPGRAAGCGGGDGGGAGTQRLVGGEHQRAGAGRDHLHQRRRAGAAGGCAAGGAGQRGDRVGGGDRGRRRAGPGSRSDRRSSHIWQRPRTERGIAAVQHGAEIHRGQVLHALRPLHPIGDVQRGVGEFAGRRRRWPIHRPGRQHVASAAAGRRAAAVLLQQSAGDGAEGVSHAARPHGARRRRHRAGCGVGAAQTKRAGGVVDRRGQILLLRQPVRVAAYIAAGGFPGGRRAVQTVSGLVRDRARRGRLPRGPKGRRAGARPTDRGDAARFRAPRRLHPTTPGGRHPTAVRTGEQAPVGGAATRHGAAGRAETGSGGQRARLPQVARAGDDVAVDGTGRAGTHGHLRIERRGTQPGLRAGAVPVKRPLGRGGGFTDRPRRPDRGI
eukprot:ctg_2129.g555